MTKNITAILIALLLSTAAFAQFWPTSGGAAGPSYQPYSQQRNASSSSTPTADDVILKETNAISKAFSLYNQEAPLPEKVKTRATLKYVITDNIQVWDGEGRVHWKGQVFSYDIPAVFLPSQDKNSHLVAVPAKEFKQPRMLGETFEMSYSTTLIAGKNASIKLSNKFGRSENGCPAGMTLRRAKNEQEADICLFQTPSRGLKEKFQAVFSNNNVTQAMAAKALKWQLPNL